MQTLNIAQHLVFKGTGRWKLACGPMLVETLNGDLLCAWLPGGDGEPARDNCVLLSRSTERGRTWEEAQVFLPAGEQASALTSWFTTADGRIVAFAASWPAEKGYTEWFYSRRVSADHGRTWSEPEPISLHHNRACLHRSIVMSNGERIFLGSIFDPRPRPLTGPIPALLDARGESEAAAIPAAAAEAGPGKFGTHRHGCCVFVNPDNVLAFDRARHIPLAKAAGYRVKSYVFECPVEDAIQRNAQRSGDARAGKLRKRSGGLRIVPRCDKSSYTDKQKRPAEQIEAGCEKKGRSPVRRPEHAVTDIPACGVMSLVAQMGFRRI